VQASTYTLMKHVDRRVFDMREAIDASTIQVQAVKNSHMQDCCELCQGFARGVTPGAAVER